MKQVISLVLGVLFCISMQAQTSISEYVNSHGQSFKVSLLIKNDKPYRVSLACEAKGGAGSIWIKPSDVGKFRDAAFKAKWILSSPVEFVLCMARVTASNNQFVKETFTIRFYSIQDVQNLIDALTQDKIDAAIRTTENSNLFN